MAKTNSHILELDDLLDIECPVCKEYMVAPIRMCETGHSFCQSCFIKLNLCPTCRQAKIPTRNFTLEKLCEVLKVPCKYKDDGCSIDVLKSKEMKDHIVKCDFRNINCPVDETCDWYGKMTELRQHCLDNHDFESDMEEWKYLPLNRSREYEMSTQVVHNNLFFYRLVTSEDNTLSYDCTHFGKSKETENFFFKLTIGDIIFQGPCQLNYLYNIKKTVFQLKIDVDKVDSEDGDCCFKYVLDILKKRP